MVSKGGFLKLDREMAEQDLTSSRKAKQKTTCGEGEYGSNMEHGYNVLWEHSHDRQGTWFSWRELVLGLWAYLKLGASTIALPCLEEHSEGLGTACRLEVQWLCPVSFKVTSFNSMGGV